MAITALEVEVIKCHCPAAAMMSEVQGACLRAWGYVVITAHVGVKVISHSFAVFILLSYNECIYKLRFPYLTVYTRSIEPLYINVNKRYII